MICCCPVVAARAGRDLPQQALIAARPAVTERPTFGRRSSVRAASNGLDPHKTLMYKGFFLARLLLPCSRPFAPSTTPVAEPVLKVVGKPDRLPREELRGRRPRAAATEPGNTPLPVLDRHQVPNATQQAEIAMAVKLHVAAWRNWSTAILPKSRFADSSHRRAGDQGLALPGPSPPPRSRRFFRSRTACATFPGMWQPPRTPANFPAPFFSASRT
jgi:hypothetical protein